MLKKAKKFLANGSATIGKVSVQWQVETKPKALELAGVATPYKIQLGPGRNWTKPDRHWVDVDADPDRGDIVVNFGEFNAFPLPDASTSVIYGSHVFEHMSIYTSQRVFEECVRVLEPGGTLRLILPDVEKSIHEYIARNAEFPLFKRRAERAAKTWGVGNYTVFDCLREDFLSRSGQRVLGQQALAHQNAWDFEAINKDLRSAGFREVTRSGFQESAVPSFDFEGAFPSEANESDRSLYVEATK
jgi:SAM-dependent methyltransferase